jgi:hypothetical protein
MASRESQRPQHLDQIQPPADAGVVAILANPVDGERQTLGLELVLPADFLQQLLHFGALEFDDLSALLAMQVLVVGVAVIVLVDDPRAEFQPAEHAGIH